MNLPLAGFTFLDLVWFVGSVAFGALGGWLTALFEYEIDDERVGLAVLLGLAGAFLVVATCASWDLLVDEPLARAVGAFLASIGAARWLYPYLRGL